MDHSVFETIKARRSVRTYDGRPLSDGDREKILACAASVENPYGIPIDFRLLDAGKDGTTSAVISGESVYIGGKVKPVPHAEEAFGYSLEKILLFALSIGVSSVWLAGTFSKSAAAAAMDVAQDEVLPAVSPLGYAAKKMSLRETVMRKGTGANNRLPFEELFFDSSLSPLKREEAGDLADALEAVRLAPSAVNRQPWRAVYDGDAVHFYKTRSAGAFDLHKIDLGIALCHFDLVLEEKNIQHTFGLADPKIDLPGAEYIATYRL